MFDNVIDITKSEKTTLSMKYKDYLNIILEIELNKNTREALLFLVSSELEDLKFNDDAYYRDIKYNLNKILSNIEEDILKINLVQADILISLLECEFIIIKEGLDFYENTEILSKIGELHILYKDILDKKNKHYKNN